VFAFAQSCADKGSLSSRFAANLKINDPNHDGVVTGDEIYADFKDNYDTDMDGCCSEKEWVDHWTSFYKFSPEFARARLAPVVVSAAAMQTSTPPASCLIKYDVYQGNTNIRFPIADFVEANAQNLVGMCLNSSIISSLKDNCDCSDLKATCINDMTFNGTMACDNFLNVQQFGAVCDGKGYIGDRFLSNVNINDADNDGFVTGPEIFVDFAQNYDVNNDSCCSLQEWNNRWETYFKFSKAYAVKRLTDISVDINVPCVINYASYKTDSSTKIPRNVFLQNNIQSLVAVCSNDADLYRTNCDCAQLKDGCTNDALLSANVACKGFINGA